MLEQWRLLSHTHLQKWFEYIPGIECCYLDWCCGMLRLRSQDQSDDAAGTFQSQTRCHSGKATPPRLSASLADLPPEPPILPEPFACFSPSENTQSKQAQMLLLGSLEGEWSPLGYQWKNGLQRVPSDEKLLQEDGRKPLWSLPLKAGEWAISPRGLADTRNVEKLTVSLLTFPRQVQTSYSFHWIYLSLTKHVRAIFGICICKVASVLMRSDAKWCEMLRTFAYLACDKGICSK